MHTTKRHNTISFLLVNCTTHSCPWSFMTIKRYSRSNLGQGSQRFSYPCSMWQGLRWSQHAYHNVLVRMFLQHLSNDRVHYSTLTQTGRKKKDFISRRFDDFVNHLCLISGLSDPCAFSSAIGLSGFPFRTRWLLLHYHYRTDFSLLPQFYEFKQEKDFRNVPLDSNKSKNPPKLGGSLCWSLLSSNALEYGWIPLQRTCTVFRNCTLSQFRSSKFDCRIVPLYFYAVRNTRVRSMYMRTRHTMQARRRICVK